MFKKYLTGLGGAIAALGLATAAQAATICTFSDPALNATTPLFTVDYTTATVVGGWSSTGLTLKTPGLPAPDFTDATFSSTPISILNQSTGALGPGTITFKDTLNNSVFIISFNSATLTGVFGLGASEFVAQSVTFSGTAVPFPLSNESFSFSFANQTSLAQDSGFTATSAFTSSATPEPASLALLIAGALAGLRRR